jgi:hypothetical protein
MNLLHRFLKCSLEALDKDQRAAIETARDQMQVTMISLAAIAVCQMMIKMKVLGIAKQETISRSEAEVLNHLQFRSNHRRK